MTLRKIKEFYTQLFSVFLNKTSGFYTSFILSLIKENNSSNKTFGYVHNFLLHQTSS
jgi:hypothetical protein